MNLITTLSNKLPYNSCVATIGFFDGVHIGHQYLIGRLKDYAQDKNQSSLLITFQRHPRLVMQADYQPKLLSTLEEKIELLSKTGVDNILTLDFTKEMSMMSARQFMGEVLREKLSVSTLIVGYDHRFGHNREETFEDYVRYGKELGIEVILANAFLKSDLNVSSSMVRSFLAEGEVNFAAECLGYNYRLSGLVERGFQVGSELGYPTANIHPNSEYKLIPKDGVYVVKVRIDKEPKEWYGMLNIGRRPTIENGDNKTIEVHVLDYQRNLYNQQITLEFITRLRDEKKFKNRGELVNQIRKDEIMVRNIIAEL